MTQSVISIVDIGLGNIVSIANAFRFVGADVNIVSTPDDISNAESLVLPGVGAFPLAMHAIHQRGLATALIKHATVDSKKLLGICLGFQLFAESSTEDHFTTGLGFLPLKVTRISLSHNPHLKVPHIGFNSVIPSPSPIPTFFDIYKEQPLDFYFVHSYCFSASQTNLLPNSASLTLSTYGIDFIASIQYQNLFGAQFHPEKSQTNGLEYLSYFLKA